MNYLCIIALCFVLTTASYHNEEQVECRCPNGEQFQDQVAYQPVECVYHQTDPQTEINTNAPLHLFLQNPNLAPISPPPPSQHPASNHQTKPQVGINNAPFHPIQNPNLQPASPPPPPQHPAPVNPPPVRPIFLRPSGVSISTPVLVTPIIPAPAPELPTIQNVDSDKTATENPPIGTPTATEPAPVVCANGFIAHPTDCRQYLANVAGAWKSYSCPPAEIFNQEMCSCTAGNPDSCRLQIRRIGSGIPVKKPFRQSFQPPFPPMPDYGPDQLYGPGEIYGPDEYYVPYYPYEPYYPYLKKYAPPRR